MTALVDFDRISAGWEPSRGEFDVIFGGLYEIYLDQRKAPRFCKDIRPMVGPYLKWCWPSRYIGEEIGALEYFSFSDYPLEEQKELLRATEKYLNDFSANRVDPNLRWVKERKARFVDNFVQFLDLMKRELAVG